MECNVVGSSVSNPKTALRGIPFFQETKLIDVGSCFIVGIAIWLKVFFTNSEPCERFEALYYGKRLAQEIRTENVRSKPQTFTSEA